MSTKIVIFAWQKLMLAICGLLAALIILVPHTAARLSRNLAPKVKGPASVEKPSPDTQLIDAFDRALQRRFHDVIGFGMARIETDKRFVPETAEEKAALASLQKAKLKVALYLAGRLVLDSKPVGSNHSMFFRRAVGRALFISSSTNIRELPQPSDLWGESQKALAAFSAGSESYDFALDQWTFRARPVRASDQSCLKCHSEDYHIVFEASGGSTIKPTGNKLKVGDPLGVLLYAFSQSR